MIIVQKYGGSSVATVEKLQQVAALVVAKKRAGADVAVVVSAMGDTTDELLTLAQKISASPPRRELDMMLSCGERISMSLLAMAIHELGEQAVSFTGSQSGIITNDNHSAAKIIEVRPFRIEDELRRGRIVIVAGYQGMSYRREITTLGRGGSDTTAVALAAALGAEACEIYSDVDGVLSADPRLIPEARQLPALSYDEMVAFAGAGAKVLNQQAVAFAREAKIKIHARKTGSESPGTVIQELAGGAAGVAHKPNVLALRDAPASVLGLLHEHRAVAEGLRGAGGRVSGWLDLENVTDAARLQRDSGGTPCALVSLIGGDIDVARAVAEAPGAWFREPHRLTMEGDAALAKKLHRLFVEEATAAR
jgi:aspartate kinase